MRYISNDHFREIYRNGYESKMNEIKSNGWDEARDSFNNSHPIGENNIPSSEYYFACGEIDALADEF